MPREQYNPDGSVTITVTLHELRIIENWGDHAAESDEPLADGEQELYDRISGLRTELEVNQGANS